ncbi:MAG TPA: hypothetical protein VFQ72_03080 [Candidatus Paceibacterota bacterium]|nr:hypothetical protein [Candidatus Paceibacterota bacterium]
MNINGTDIRKQIHDKTWKGGFWGRGGAIELARDAYRDPGDGMALASTYYAAAGNAAARAASEKGLRKVAWNARAAALLCRALWVSGRFERWIGRSNIAADQLDVRATILRRCGFRSAALERIDLALLKRTSADTEMLLLTGKAEILAEQGKGREAWQTFHEASLLSPAVKPTTLVRFYKARARRSLRIGWSQVAEEDLSIARDIARAHGLDDQLEKIQPLLDHLRSVPLRDAGRL